jgi:hypothetical protein
MVYFKHTITVFPTTVTYQQQQQQQRHGVKSKKELVPFFLTLSEGTKTLRSINESNGSRAQLSKAPAAALINATGPHVATN